MHYRQRQSLGVVLLVLSLACTIGVWAQTPTSVPDLKSVAGKWRGTGQSAVGTYPLEWNIKEDGTVDVVAGTPSGTVTGKAKFSIKDGKLFYESGSSSGPVTLQEDGGRRVLKYEAVFKRDNSRGGAELTPAQ